MSDQAGSNFQPATMCKMLCEKSFRISQCYYQDWTLAHNPNFDKLTQLRVGTPEPHLAYKLPPPIQQPGLPLERNEGLPLSPDTSEC